MYFKGLLFRVGEHAIADVPQSGLAGSGPEDKNKQKKEDAGRGGRRPSQYLSILPWVVTCGWQTFQKYDIFCIFIFLKTGNPHIKTKSISTPSCAVIWKHRVFCGGGGVETEQCFAFWLLTKKKENTSLYELNRKIPLCLLHLVSDSHQSQTENS